MEIEKIKIGNRFRKDTGSLEELKDSIKEIGLLQPIVIDEDNNLIAGERRLLAFKELGKKEIDVNIINIKDSLKGEFDENVVRKGFSPSELVAIWQAMENKQGLRYESQRSKPIEKASKTLGVGTQKLSQAKQVMEFGNNKLIEEMDRTGNVNKVYKEIKKTKRINEQVERGKKVKETPAELYNDDFNNIKLKENSIDCIITDPPYPKEFLNCWKDLAVYAKRVLKPGGFLIAYSGQLHMREVMNMLSEELNYYWTFCLYHKGGTQIVNARNTMCRWKPIFIYQKLPFKKYRVVEDYVVSEQIEKDGHEWQQSESGVKSLIEKFTEAGDTILDPFMGAGTFPYVATQMKRKAIGIEIDKKSYLISKSKYDKTRN